MRETVGNTWLYSLVLTFILLFSAFLSIAINYSRVFKVKNEMLSILEKYEGYNAKSNSIINGYLSSTGYKTTGTCPSGYYGVSELSTNNITSISGSGSSSTSGSYYCLRWDSTIKRYDIILFFKFNLPVIGDITTIKITGKTKRINYVTQYDGL